MKIYLAGKMDEHGAWRDALLGTTYDSKDHVRRGRWHIVRDGAVYDDYTVRPWPTTPNRWILGMHDYVGPYRTTYREGRDASRGDFHGSEVEGQHGMPNFAADHDQIIQDCESAIRRADLVFAYLNQPDCFGTLIEIGLAKAYGTPVYVSMNEDEASWDYSDYWFVSGVAEWAGNPYHVWRHQADPKTDDERALGYFKDALIHWTAREPGPLGTILPTAIRKLEAASPENYFLGANPEVADSFAQIARWSSDPRVRNEAARMLRRLCSGA